MSSSSSFWFLVPYVYSVLKLVSHLSPSPSKSPPRDGSAWTFSTGPSQITVPSCRTVTVRAICRTKSMSCSITTIACFSANDGQSNRPVCSVSSIGHPGHRFIHEQKRRILQDHHADFEPLLLAVRQGTGPVPGHCLSIRSFRGSRRSVLVPP